MSFEVLTEKFDYELIEQFHSNDVREEEFLKIQMEKFISRANL